MDWLTGIALMAGLVACLEFWFLLGQRARRRRNEHPDQLAAIQGAMLGLLALLLGFSFALAAGRFSDRVELITQEANAIGTAWLRADLLGNQPRAEVRDLLRQYTRQRIDSYEARTDAEWKAAITSSESLQQRFWSIVVEACRATPELSVVLLPAFNEMFDLESTRVAASRRHLPGMLLALLLASSAVSVAAVGYGCGVAGKRNVVLTTSLSFLIAGVLWSIIDMDHPRRGLIRAGQQPLLDLQSRFERGLPPQGKNPAP